MPAPRLYDLAKKVGIRSIALIVDIGDIPYKLVRPVLLKLENPEQLHQLELASPQIIGEDAEIWRAFMKRDIPNWADHPREPKDGRSWYRLYCKLQLAAKQQIEADAEALMATLQGIKDVQATRTTKVVDPRTVPKLPRMGGMRAEGGRPGGNAGGARLTNNSVLSFGGGSRSKTATGRDVIEKARRQAREMRHFSQAGHALARPAHQLAQRSSHMNQAPKGLVEDHKREVRTTIHAPRRPGKLAPAESSFPSARPVAAAGPSSSSTQERERRLKAFTSPKRKADHMSSDKPAGDDIFDDQDEDSADEPRINSKVAGSSSIPAPIAYKLPKPRPSPDTRPKAVVKKPAVDIFMPVKRKRVT